MNDPREGTEPSSEKLALDRLNESNRILTEARMLPTDKSLTQIHINQVIDAFERHIEKWQVTVAQVARELNYSEAVLSQWRSNTYKGDMDGVTRAANEWIERDSRRRAAAAPKDSVKTWVAETMRAIAFQADKRCMMAAIVSPAGSGKTKVLRALTEEMRGVYLYCTDSMARRDFLIALALAVGKKGYYNTMNSAMRHIVEALKGTKRIIFLDEAHQLKKAMSCVRAVSDQAGVPIVMAGTADVLDLVNDRIDGRGQFSSRTIRCNLLDYVRNVEGPGGGDGPGRDLFTIEEIKAFFGSRKIRLATDAMHLAWSLSCLVNYGTLRLVGNLVDIAADVLVNVPVLTRAHLVEALQMLVGGEAKYLLKLADLHASKSRKHQGIEETDALAKVG